MIKRVFFLIIIFFLIGCKEEIFVPKPKAFLNLKYPSPVYKKNNFNLPFTFDLNNVAEIINLNKDRNNFNMEINYKILNASLYLSYYRINKNFKDLVNQTEFILSNHTKIAQKVSEKQFISKEKRVFGSLYELTGPVASTAQFFVTDSINHFLTGSLFFKIKPNYDSILPAANYAKKDIIRLMESLKWKN